MSSLAASSSKTQRPVGARHESAQGRVVNKQRLRSLRRIGVRGAFQDPSEKLN